MLDTIIIGAGFAGLSAAQSLKAHGQDQFLVLEARDRVGGRTKQGTLQGVDIDLGGMWLGPTQERLKNLAEKYQLRTYPTFLDGLAVYRLKGKEHHGRGEDLEKIFSMRDRVRAMFWSRALKKMVAGIDCERPWDHPDADRLDAMTVEEWLQKTLRSPRLIEFYRLVCFSLFCAEASQISMLFFLHYVKSGGGLDVLLSAGEGGAQNFLFYGGVHQIARKMAQELGDRLHLNEAALGVDWSEDAVTVRTALGQHRARHAIIAVPPTLLLNMDFSPALPQKKIVLHRRLHMGSAIKYWVVYEKPFWRAQGWNGIIARDDVPSSPCFDVTPPEETRGFISGFFDGNHAIDCSDMGRDARRKIVLDMLADHYGDAARAPLEYIDEDWTEETWSGGCYGAYAPPGIYASYGEGLRKPIGPLYWAGTETSPVWTGYIEGAIHSGEYAAKEVMKAQSPDGRRAL